MSASSRTSLCLDCRVLLPVGERCELNARHEVVDLQRADGRAALRSAIWDAPRIRRFVTPETRVLIFAGLGAALVLTALTFGAIGALIAFIAIIVMPGVVLGVLALIHHSYRPALPRGTSPHMLLPWRRSKRGVVHGDSTIRAPLTGRPCIAYIVCYTASNYYGGDVMLVDCATGGFSVQLDDGRDVEIPAGRIRLEVPQSQAVADLALIHEHVERISQELRNDGTEARPHLPYDSATEGLLGDGDRVELFCQLNEVTMSYRETAKRFVPMTVPRVRVLKPAAPPTS